jgi:transposase-like protein
MSRSPYHGHRFPPPIIQHVVWLYLRFTLSLRDVEDILAERGLDLTYETVRRWVGKFGPLFARDLRKQRPRPTARWHLDEMVVTIAGKRHWLWRTVDDEGEVLDILVQSRRDTRAAIIRPVRHNLRPQRDTFVDKVSCTLCGIRLDRPCFQAALTVMRAPSSADMVLE